ncbi:hypothetical protein BLOT_010503 [Blomia tropicalis]|nr:hypothetical protein BLOT_010503 [Blomia tropicalis]
MDFVMVDDDLDSGSKMVSTLIGRFDDFQLRVFVLMMKDYNTFKNVNMTMLMMVMVVVVVVGVVEVMVAFGEDDYDNNGQQKMMKMGPNDCGTPIDSYQTTHKRTNCI